MGLSKRFALNVVAYVSAAIVKSRLYQSLPWRSTLGNVWWFFLGDISFSFDAEVAGINFRLSGPLRYMSSGYYFPYITQGAHEPPVLAHITQVVKQCASPRILDVGAHYGWYTVYLAKLAADRGTIFAFEPSEKIFAYLKRNVELNGLNNVHLYKIPLSDKREVICMAESRRFKGERREMVPVDEKASTKSYSDLMNSVPFDELNDAELIYPNIVMIDVHGVYRKVLDGMIECLRRDVEHLYIETFNPWGDLYSQSKDIRHVVSTLRDLGFDVYEIQNYLRVGNNGLLKADANSIIKKGISSTMLYACKPVNDKY